VTLPGQKLNHGDMEERQSRDQKKIHREDAKNAKFEMLFLAFFASSR